MSDNDDVDLSWVMVSGKAENDRRAKLRLPLDGNVERHSRADETNYGGSRGGSGGGSLLGTIIVALGWAIFYASMFGLWLMWQIIKVVASAIFSSRR